MGRRSFAAKPTRWGRTFYCSSDCHHKVGESERIFLSYRWCDSEIASKIAGCARGAGIEVIRDVNAMGFLDAISEFMETAAESRYFVAVMTESYFYSRYCLYEFCQLMESDQPIRTVPVILGGAAKARSEERVLKYWHARRQDLCDAIRGIDERYSGYLRPELDLLAKIPDYVASFLQQWRAKTRPEGKNWLAANCRYLVGAIKTTFRPTEEDATNWTYSNKTVRAERAPDAPPASTWNPEPFHLHAYSERESQNVTRFARARNLVLGIYHEGPMTEIPAGVHLVLVNSAALGSLLFCTRLLRLMDHDGVTVVPMFLDEPLRRPAGEVALLRQWHRRLRRTTDPTRRAAIDYVLRNFGPTIQLLRDTLVPAADVVFGA